MDRPTRAVDSQSTDRRIWLDYFDYGRRLFAPDEDVRGKADAYISVVGQVQRLLRSDVLQIRVDDFYRAVVETDPELLASFRGGRLTSVLRSCLANTNAAMTTKAVVDAVSALFLNLPVVVLIDGGSNWLRWAAGLAGADYETSVTADQVDRTSVYLADLLRRLSDSSVCAVVIDLSSRASETVSEEFDLHRPMTNLARHYQWQTGILVEEISVDLMGIRADFVLTTTTTPGFDSSKIGDQAPMKAITLDRDFWLSDSFMEIPGSGLCYGKVPADANPERVLARLAGLRSR